MERSTGQVLPLILFSIVIGAVLMVVMFNATQKVTDKTIATNASDAAVYSAGVWTARQLNFMAYTNRAMIANHVATGHIVTYVSWMRYVDDSAKNLNKIARFIPYFNAVMAAVKKMSSITRIAAEKSAEVFVPTVNSVNKLYALAQKTAIYELQAVRVNKVMERVVKAHDPTLEVNRTSMLSNGPGRDYKMAIDAHIAGYVAALAGAVEVLAPGKDKDEMRRMVELSYAGSERWFNNRKWSKSFVVFKLRKEANTDHTLNAKLSEWKANDKLRYGRLTTKGWKWSTIGSGEADSAEFDSNYKGIESYTRKRGKPERALYIDLVTLATKSDTATVPLSRTRMQIDSKGATISGYSKARVYYKRPREGFAKAKEEFANLYNPFWNVKLVSAWP